MQESKSCALPLGDSSISNFSIISYSAQKSIINLQFSLIMVYCYVTEYHLYGFARINREGGQSPPQQPLPYSAEKKHYATEKSGRRFVL